MLKMKSMGIWMSILVVLAVTRRASAEGELETDSERDKRKFFFMRANKQLW